MEFPVLSLMYDFNNHPKRTENLKIETLFEP